MSSEKNNSSDIREDQVESSRRKFLKTAGKIAIYTPPVMLAVARPDFAHAQSSGGSSYEDVRNGYSQEEFASLWERFLRWLGGLG